MSEENTPSQPEAPQVSPQQQQQNQYVDLVVSKLKSRLGDRDIEIAQLEARLELVMAERDYFLKGLRDNGLIHDADAPAPMAPPTSEAVPADEVEVLPSGD